MVLLFQHILPLLSVWPVIFSLMLKESVVPLSALSSEISALAAIADSSLQDCHKV